MSVSLSKAWQYLGNDPETNIPKLMDLVDKVAPEGWYEEQRKAFRGAIDAKNNWYQLIMKVWELDEGVRNTFFNNFIVNASLLEVQNRRKPKKRKAATCRGQSFSILLPHATFTAPDAGLLNTATA